MGKSRIVIKPEHMQLIREMRLAGVTWFDIEGSQPYSLDTMQKAYWAKYGRDRQRNGRGKAMETTFPQEAYRFIKAKGGHDWLRQLVAREMEAKA